MEKKEIYLNKVQEQLSEWKEELKVLHKQAETAGAEIAKGLPEQINILEQKIKEGSAKLKEVVDTNEEAFEALREGIDSAWKALSSGFEEARSKFRREKD